ncbi:MAG: hypothetical protein SFX73_27270 [Kofleriaceae bacterium]|nr:hypothetical protein [Kofleriaceae bacterium]
MRSFTLPLALLASLGGGCVDDSVDGGIFVTKNVAPGDNCTFTSTESELFLPHGVWSVLSPGGYLAFPQMSSRITATAAQEDQRTVILQGARIDVEITDPVLAGELDLQGLAAAGVTRFQSLFTAPLAPNGGITDGSIELIPRRLIDEIIAVRPDISPTAQNPVPFRTELLASFVVFGELAGEEVTSQRFSFPVTLCNDCVVNNFGACPLSFEGDEGNPCNPYQDGEVDCCVDPIRGLLCPGPSASTAR